MRRVFGGGRRVFLSMSIGTYFRQKWQFLFDKIVREKATPEYIARGWAIGMFCGCFIPFGLQLIFSVPASFLLKGSKTGAVLGTLITNHFTVFVIYPAQCYAGALLTGRMIPYSALEEAMKGVIEQNNFESLAALGTDVAVAFFVGGFLLAAIMTPITYFFVRSVARKRGAMSGSAAAEADKTAK